ncbi:MAG: hypothetical protein LC777_09440 [Actinobacteria bacterium]|nr:hypothetical protein [Actinomycetota bacterium]
MSELHFDLCWPDSSVKRCDSPSRSVKQYVKAGAPYPLACSACSSAEDQLDRIKARARAIGDSTPVQVTVNGVAQ